MKPKGTFERGMNMVNFYAIAMLVTAGVLIESRGDRDTSFIEFVSSVISCVFWPITLGQFICRKYKQLLPTVVICVVMATASTAWSEVVSQGSGKVIGAYSTHRTNTHVKMYQRLAPKV
jgi:hypothetical protein